MRLLSLAIALVVLSSCSHRVVRLDYDRQPASEGCKVVVTKSKIEHLDRATPVGRLELNDSGFSTKCSEADAVETLMKEACSMNANIVLIHSERQPNIMSTCYRCEATLYRTDSIPGNLNERELLNTDLPKKKENVGAQALGAIIGGAVGFAVGYLLVSALLK